MAFADALKARLRDLVTVTPRAARLAAPRVQAQARADLTTARGNVPWFKGSILGSSDIPIVSVAIGSSVQTRAVGWAMRRAYDRNYVARWTAIVRAAGREAARGK